MRDTKDEGRMFKEKINVTKTFLPPLEEYQRYLEEIWERNWLTNQGPLAQAFETKVARRLGVSNMLLVSNGTLALQVALSALNITEGEIITTPFSYVATVSSILWERCTPVFVDIEADTLSIDAEKIEAAITPQTKAIMPVHVFGYPCDTTRIEAIAKKHKIKVVYDAAHCFGAEYQGRSLLDYGDASICSFHATKLFHAIEGGGIVAKDAGVYERAELIRRFGHTGDEHFMLGINAKASEFHAAMGLCNLKYVNNHIVQRKRLSELYDRLLGEAIQTPRVREGTKQNYGYYPVVLESEKKLLQAIKQLNKENIFPRRYFFPELNTLPYIKKQYPCPIAEDIARRIMCLPLYVGLEEKVVHKICEVLTV